MNLLPFVGERTPYDVSDDLAEFVRWLSQPEANRVCFMVASILLEKTSSYHGSYYILIAGTRPETATYALIVGSLSSNGLPFEAVSLLAVVKQIPSACILSTQQLVELLKMPTCYGEPRRVILDHLENRYHAKFADQWTFVRYAETHRLGLDFTSPPKRPTTPQPAAP